MAIVPEDLLYSRDHEWVRVEGDTATVGITDFAQGELGDVVYVECPEAGTAVEQGAVFGTIESVKSVSDLRSPLSGEVSEVNEELEGAPELVNEDPYDGGWILRIQIADPDELAELLGRDGYRALIAEEG